MIIPESKVALVNETKELVADYEQQYQDGLITQQEKYNKVIDAWSRCGDQVANAMMEELKAQPIDPETGRMAQINRSEEHTSELQSLMRISYAVFCLKTKKHNKPQQDKKRH